MNFNSNLLEYKRLSLNDLSPDILTHFIRRQEVKKTWRKVCNEWALIDNPFVVDWDEKFHKKLINEDLPEAINSGGALFGGYYNGKLIAFSVVDGNLLGSSKQYARKLYRNFIKQNRLTYIWSIKYSKIFYKIILDIMDFL
jgi:hypothetical protein